MALAASMTLASCDKDEEFAGNTDTAFKSVTVKLPNIKKNTTRAIGDAVADESKVSLINYKVFFLDASNKEVAVPAIEGQAQQVYFSSTTGEGWDDNVSTDDANNAKTYHFLPASAVKVVVVGNMDNVNWDDVDGQDDEALEVLNDTEDGHPYYPLRGESPLSLKTDAVDDEKHNNVYEAIVNLEPRTARFEIYGFEYKLAEGNTQFTYEKVELAKIALSNYYMTYDFVSKKATGTAEVAPTETSKVWDWMNATVAPWANSFAATFEVEQEAKKFANGTSMDDNYADGGEGATGIITYGLTEVEDAANNPELLLTFYGVDAAGSKTPLYVRGKFTQSEAFKAGKIYRVMFPILDAVWNQPDRCVELTVEVAKWEVVPVTPEF